MHNICYGIMHVIYTTLAFSTLENGDFRKRSTPRFCQGKLSSLKMLSNVDKFENAILAL